MTTKFKIGDEVMTVDGRVGFVRDIIPSEDPTLYGVKLQDSIKTFCFTEHALTAANAAPAAPAVPQPPPTVQIGNTWFTLDTIAFVIRAGTHVTIALKIADGDGDCVQIGADYNLPHIKAFCAWWTSNTIAFVPEATDDMEADNG